MAEAKGVVKQQLQAMTEMKERVDKYGPLLSPEDQAFLSEQVALSLRKCKLYMDMEEAIQKAEKAKKEPVKKEEPVKTDETKEEKPKKVEETTEEEKAEVKGEIEKSIEKPYENYSFPPISILNKAEVVSQDKRREMYETATKLLTVLKNFGVEAKLLQVTQGPTVTRYEIQPSTGVKLAKITSLSEDIALNLAVPTVLVAAVPGKAAVGIEIPNNTIGTVSVRELIESDNFKNAKSKISAAFGKDI